MTNKSVYPIFFRPIYKDYLWGGKRIIEKYHRIHPDLRVIAESWEIADHQDGMSVVANGAYEGLSLHELLKELGQDLTGEKSFERFPLLIKLIDSHQNLSIQVHPDDETAKRICAEPKTEMWYVIEAKQSTSVLAGFKQKTTREEVEEMIKKKKVSELVQSHQISTDDVIYIPAGTIHAVMEGCLLLEVQQNSNTTFRVYDWGRGRELHIDKALQSLHYDQEQNLLQKPELVEEKEHEKRYRLLQTPYFCIEKIETREIWRKEKHKKSFQIFFALSGEGVILAGEGREMFLPGRCFLVPACSDFVEVRPIKKPFVFLRITL